MPADDSTVLTLAALALFAVGVVGIAVPVLPGLLLCLAAVGLWALGAGDPVAWWTLAAAAVVYAVGLVLQLLIPGRRMRRRGVGGATITVGLLAGVVGLFAVPVVGGPLFFVGAVYLVERLRTRDGGRARAATGAAVRGVLHSMGIELATAMLIGGAWLAGYLLTRG